MKSALAKVLHPLAGRPMAAWPLDDALAAGASPVEAAIFSNYAAGVVVGKVGTATATPEEVVAAASAAAG